MYRIKSYWISLHKMGKQFVGLLGLLLLMACSEEEAYVPKPHGFPHVVLPEQKYEPLGPAFRDYPYQFEVNQVTEVLKDTAGLHEPYWILINYPDWKAQITITYKPLFGDTMAFWYLNEDARKLTHKHQVKAYAIDEASDLRTKDGDEGIIFSLSGEVATQFQFYTTDSAHHFFRGALYFRTAHANDSLAPMINYISEDMTHLLETFHWRDEFELDPALKDEFN